MTILKTHSWKGRKTLSSQFWYGSFRRDRKKIVTKLNVRIDGTPPASLRSGDPGDAAYERSRVRAELQLEQMIAEARDRQSHVQVLKRIHRLQTGHKLPTLKLEAAYAHWLALKEAPADPDDKTGDAGDADYSERYLSQAESAVGKFLDFVRRKEPTATEVGHITADIGRQYMASRYMRKLSPKTFNNTLTLLRSVFGDLLPEAGLPENPFASVKRRKKPECINRVPFTLEQIERILRVIKEEKHGFVRPIIITALCTAMRRGDCCRWTWDCVNLEENFIAVKAHKTNALVQSIFPLLAEEIRRHLPKRSEYVFPLQAAVFDSNPDAMTHRCEQVLRNAGFSDASGGYCDGGSDLRLKRVKGRGIRRANIRGLNSFRGTWITIALNMGVVPEIVRKITGHTAMEVVLAHYYKPAREDIRRELMKKMPAFFNIGQPAEPASSDGKSLLKAIEAMTHENWESVRGKILAALGDTTPNPSA
ncbi:MAG: tyrosine-type recombinase/integrase [Opitutaceae bacterium]|nr:tyrosine-type recombinase/integrase [Opitutaceae bacterium]